MGLKSVFSFVSGGWKRYVTRDGNCFGGAYRFTVVENDRPPFGCKECNSQRCSNSRIDNARAQDDLEKKSEGCYVPSVERPDVSVVPKVSMYLYLLMGPAEIPKEGWERAIWRRMLNVFYCHLMMQQEAYYESCDGIMDSIAELHYTAMLRFGVETIEEKSFVKNILLQQSLPEQESAPKPSNILGVIQRDPILKEIDYDLQSETAFWFSRLTLLPVTWIRSSTPDDLVYNVKDFTSKMRERLREEKEEAKARAEEQKRKRRAIRKNKEAARQGRNLDSNEKRTKRSIFSFPGNHLSDLAIMLGPSPESMPHSAVGVFAWIEGINKVYDFLMIKSNPYSELAFHLRCIRKLALSRLEKNLKEIKASFDGNYMPVPLTDFDRLKYQTVILAWENAVTVLYNSRLIQLNLHRFQAIFEALDEADAVKDSNLGWSLSTEERLKLLEARKVDEEYSIYLGKSNEKFELDCWYPKMNPDFLGPYCSKSKLDSLGIKIREINTLFKVGEDLALSFEIPELEELYHDEVGRLCGDYHKDKEKDRPHTSGGNAGIFTRWKDRVLEKLLQVLEPFYGRLCEKGEGDGLTAHEVFGKLYHFPSSQALKFLENNIPETTWGKFIWRLQAKIAFYNWAKSLDSNPLRERYHSYVKLLRHEALTRLSSSKSPHLEQHLHIEPKFAREILASEGVLLPRGRFLLHPIKISDQDTSDRYKE